jgi:hypothetical protein
MRMGEPTKALRHLRDVGVIATGYRSLIIQNFSGLNEIAGP